MILSLLKRALRWFESLIDWCDPLREDREAWKKRAGKGERHDKVHHPD